MSPECSLCSGGAGDGGNGILSADETCAEEVVKVGVGVFHGPTAFLVLVFGDANPKRRVGPRY